MFDAMVTRVKSAALILMLLLAGCASTNASRFPSEPAPDAPVLAQSSPSRTGSNTKNQRLAQVQTPLGMSRPPSFDAERNIFFPSQSTVLSRESMQVLRRLSERLKANPRMSVVLIGHTDDLGSNEYCIAHASLLTSAVADALVKLDVRPSQIRELPKGSVGSAYPGCTSDDCRRSLRRVELEVSGS